MKIIETIAELKTALNEERNRGKSVGLVPTMGYLHEGHLSLMRRAELQNDVVVASIFVNPTQFGPNEDLDAYPRDLKRDLSLAESVGVDYLFAPKPNEIYPKGFSTYVEIGSMAEILCGASRPGHFRGVLTVVLKLFNIAQPNKAYFGKKDYQQLALIKKMASDLNLSIEIVALETVRESDGLALSSRNKYLTEEERKAAAALSQGLFAVKAEFERGETESARLAGLAKSFIEKEELIDLEYLTICDNISLEPLTRLKASAVMLLAAKVGKARLIDNIELDLRVV